MGADIQRCFFSSLDCLCPPLLVSHMKRFKQKRPVRSRRVHGLVTRQIFTWSRSAFQGSITDGARPGFSPLIIATAKRSSAQALQPLSHLQSWHGGIIFFNPPQGLNVNEDVAPGARRAC